MAEGEMAAAGGRRYPLAWRHRPAVPAADAGALAPAVARLRWAVLAGALLITLVWPGPGRTGHPLWLLVLAFIGYNALVELARRRVRGLRSFAWVPLVDLPVAGLLYYLDVAPGGPLFTTFYLAVVTAAATGSVPRALGYTLATAAVIAAVAPTLPAWAATAEQLQQLSARLIVLGLAGVGTASLARRLVAEQARAYAVRDEAARLEELDRLRSNFIATVSHELRTPLTSAGLAASLLEARAAGRPVEERELIGVLRRNLNRLSHHVDNLLTVNQVDAGTLAVACTPLDLRAAAAEAAAAVAPLLADKGQALALDLPGPLPIRGDARRLDQVLVNLLANAHHHTPPGTRIAVVGWVAGDEVRLAVADTGPGIPADALGRVFERHYHLDPARPGSGLGLATVRSLVEAHGGRAWAESVPGEGATFHVALPRAGPPCEGGAHDGPEDPDRRG